MRDLGPGRIGLSSRDTKRQTFVQNMSPTIAVLTRTPVPGSVKTRLIPRLGAERAAQLHARMVEHTLATLALARIGSTELWCAADADLSLSEACASKLGVPLHMQPEGDLGQRMSAIAAQVLARSRGVIMVGTDVPSMMPGDLIEARQALRAHDAVLGPAEDGGYYLIGLTRHAPELFDGIDWGSAAVLAQTRIRLLGLRWRVHELQVRWDVDTPEDYDRLQADRRLSFLAQSLAAAGSS